MTHICVSNLTIIGSDNGLSHGRRQTIIWTNDGILLIGPLGTNFSEILIGIQTFSFKKMHLKMSSAKWRPFCLGLNVLMAFCKGQQYRKRFHAMIPSCFPTSGACRVLYTDRLPQPLHQVSVNICIIHVSVDLNGLTRWTIVYCRYVQCSLLSTKKVQSIHPFGF